MRGNRGKPQKAIAANRVVLKVAATEVVMTLRWTVIALLLCGPLPLCAQSPAAGGTRSSGGQETGGSQAPSLPAKIDPVKEADIRRLLDLVGTKALVEQSLDSMSKSVRPLLANSLPPGDYREKLVDLFFEKFKAKLDVQHLLELAIPSY